MPQQEQVYNPEQIELLKGTLQPRNEPNFAWGQAAGGLSLLPGLRGLWTLGTFSSGAFAYDHSGLGGVLAYNGNPTYRYSGLFPYIDLDGVGDYLSMGDVANFDIIGNEAYVVSTQRGLTLGGWFSFDRINTGEDLITKWVGGGNQRSYELHANNTAGTSFVISTDGINTVGAASANNIRTAGSEWYFVAGRFIPSTEVAVFTNILGASILTKYTNVVGIPATIFNSTAGLTIGGRSDATVLLDGQASLCWICAMALSDTQIQNIFHQTRALYGV